MSLVDIPRSLTAADQNADFHVCDCRQTRGRQQAPRGRSGPSARTPRGSSSGRGYFAESRSRQDLNDDLSSHPNTPSSRRSPPFSVGLRSANARPASGSERRLYLRPSQPHYELVRGPPAATTWRLSRTTPRNSPRFPASAKRDRTKTWVPRAKSSCPGLRGAHRGTLEDSLCPGHPGCADHSAVPLRVNSRSSPSGTDIYRVIAHSANSPRRDESGSTRTPRRA